MRARVMCFLGFSLAVGLNVVGASTPLGAQSAPRSLAAAVGALERTAGGPVAVAVSPLTGAPSFLRTGPGRAIPLSAAASAPADERALAFLRSHGGALRLPTPDQVVVLNVSGPDEVGMDHVRIQQVYRGIPVRGAQLTVHLRGASLVALHAKALPGVEGMGTIPAVTASQALGVAAAAVAEYYGISDADLGLPRLEIFNRGVLDGTSAPTRLAWFVEGRGPLVRAYLWVDAHTAEVLLHFNQLPDALDRQVHDAAGTAQLPGPLARSEGEPPTGDADVDNAYDYTGDTYAYYLSQHGRDSYDDAGATMIATVDSTLCGDPCINAFWVGTQTVFGQLMVMDDIVGHEWTHGVTQFTAGLIYFEQSGALSESFSDIFGETVDLTNGRGTDTPDKRWGVGEDMAPGHPVFFGFRHMMDPTLVGDPGRTSDSEFWCDEEDGRGVHSNSGVPNHAYALMVDGGTYNDFSVDGIGLTKAGKVQYRALSVYLTASSNFLDDYDALQQSCVDLIGTSGITAADCDEVRDALDAVEMHFPWPCKCGDGIAGPGEECDDGNQVEGDGCDSNCTETACGNGIVTAGEQCDGGDCCLATCQFQASGAICANDGDTCGEHRCDGAGTCQAVWATGTCDDGDPLTVGDVCVDGVCTGRALIIDHFKCYKAKDLKAPAFVPTTVRLDDQFGVNDGEFEVKKPFLVCNPADKNDEGIDNPTDHLACFKIKGPKLDKGERPQVEVWDQFGALQLEAKKPFLLCVPSAKTTLP